MNAARDPSHPPAASELLRGSVETAPEGELVRRAAKGKLRVKFGADPTAPDLHLGHMVALRKLRQFQDHGHTVVFIIGDFTARIGDPSGRNATRPPLSPEAIEKNAATYMDQVFQVLDKNRTTVVRNSAWLEKLTFVDVLRLASQQTVAQILQRQDFRQRIEEKSDVRLHEFLYPLMQGYDSVVVKADVEIGGADQVFNLLVGRDMQEKAGQKPQCILTMPLLVGTDGKQKMSKSYGNYIAFRDAPQEMFGKVMSVPDALLFDYWLLLTDRDEKEISALRAACESGKENPRHAKAALGRHLVEFFHGAAAARSAEEHFQQVIVNKEAPEEVDEFVVPTPAPDLPTILATSGLVASKGEARRLIDQGAVYINGGRYDNAGGGYTPKDGDMIKVGKRRFVRLKTGG